MKEGKKALFLLSTEDNPYSPFSDWERWYMEDLRLGYDTCGLIARTGADPGVFDDGTDYDTIRAIVSNNFSGKHIVVVPEDFDSS